VLIAGQSRGGILSVAYAAERAETVRGVINFAGGWTSQRCDEGGRGFNSATFRSAGGRTRIPMLWLYAEEDGLLGIVGERYYGPLPRRRVAAFTFPRSADGRLVDRVELWKADDFLQRLNLRSR
jgi:pimeloyl-ACP methyl ester carboxylesterase